MKITNLNLMKVMNLNNVRKLLRHQEYATKPELAKLSGLSVVTINSLVNELIDRKEVVTSQVAPSTGGRPATRYQYDLNYCLALILTIYEQNSVDLLSAKVVNLNGEEIYGDIKKNDDMNLGLWFDMIDAIILQYPQIEAIGIAIPGQIFDGEIKVGSHESLIGLHLGDIIEERYQKDVIFDNDVNAAVLGYCNRKATNEISSLVGLYFPQNTPPGAAVFLNDQIIKGKHGMAGEIKYLRNVKEWTSSSTIDDLYKKIYQTIHTFISTLAPEEILIYREDIQEKKFILGWEKYAKNHQLPVLPQINFESYLEEDMIRGMKEWTMNLLNEKFLNKEI